MRSRYRCVDCRRGVIVVIALNAGEHIIGSRGFKAGGDNGRRPLGGFFARGVDGILLFFIKSYNKAIGFYIRYSRLGGLFLICPCYGERCFRPGRAVFRSFAGGKRYLNFICTCFVRSRFKFVIQAVEIFNSPIHAYNFFRADFRRLLCAVIGEVEDVEVYNNGFLLLKHSLYRHVRAAHGEGYVSSLCFCFRQGYTGNFPLDELVVKVAWFGGKGDLVAFAHNTFRYAGNGAAFAESNGQFIRSLGSGDSVALYDVARIIGFRFGITRLNVIGLAIFNGEAGG